MSSELMILVLTIWVVMVPATMLVLGLAARTLEERRREAAMSVDGCELPARSALPHRPSQRRALRTCESRRTVQYTVQRR